MSSAQQMITSGQQRQYDLALAPYDCWATAAHVRMLASVGIMTNSDASSVSAVIAAIGANAVDGNFPYDPSLGLHLTLEKLIVDQVGPDIGYRVHTGRSRNDQVATAQKLFVRDRVLEVLWSHANLVDALLRKGSETLDVVMPGYTHMQPARVTTFGQWCAAYADMILRDAQRLRDAYARHNTSPLGAAESYGTSWPIDRELTARLLAFDSVHKIPIDAISNRGESETDFLAALAMTTTHLSRLAEDLLLMNTFEYGMVELGEATAQRMGSLTGSSIMPQKKNPDILELVRANASLLNALLMQCLGLMKALPMGYNRDSRETKGPIVQGIQAALTSLDQMADLIGGLILNEDRMSEVVNANYSMATDCAEFIAQQTGQPYRVIYRIMGAVTKQAVADRRALSTISAAEFNDEATKQECEARVTRDMLSEGLDPVKAINRRTIVGGTERSTMEHLISRRLTAVSELRLWHESQVTRIAAARDALMTQPVGISAATTEG